MTDKDIPVAWDARRLDDYSPEEAENAEPDVKGVTFNVLASNEGGSTDDEETADNVGELQNAPSKSPRPKSAGKNNGQARRGVDANRKASKGEIADTVGELKSKSRLDTVKVSDGVKRADSLKGIIKVTHPAPAIVAPTDEEKADGVKDADTAANKGTYLVAAADSLEVENVQEVDIQATTLDGGYGWVVLAATVIIAILVGGWSRGYSVLYPVLQKRFDSSAAITAFIGGVMSALRMSASPLAIWLSGRYTARVVICSGGILLGGGALISSVAPSIYFMFFSYSILCGFGAAFSYAPSVVLVGQYFQRLQGLAQGIATGGSGIGLFLVPFVLEQLLNYYSYMGALWIVGGLLLHCCVSGMLCRPINWSGTAIKIAQVEPVQAQNEHDLEQNRAAIPMIPEDAATYLDQSYILLGQYAASFASFNYSFLDAAALEQARAHHVENFDTTTIGTAIDYAHAQQANYDTTTIVTAPPLEDAQLQQDNIQAQQANNEPTTMEDSSPPQQANYDATTSGTAPDVAPPRQVQLPSNFDAMTITTALDVRRPKRVDGTANYDTMTIGTSNDLAQRKTRRTVSVADSIGTSFDLRRKKTKVESTPATGSTTQTIGTSATLGRKMTKLIDNVSKVVPYSSSFISLVPITPAPDRLLSKQEQRLLNIDETATIATVLPPSPRYFEWSLLKNVMFVRLASCLCLITMSYSAAQMLLVGLARSKGVENWQASLLVSIVGLTETIGGIVFGIIFDLKFVQRYRVKLYNVSMVPLAATCFWFILAKSFSELAICSAIHGLLCGEILGLRVVIAAEVMGIERLASSYGLISFFQGIGLLVGPALAGLLSDMTDSYTWSYVFTGAGGLLAALIFIFNLLQCSCREYNYNYEDPMTARLIRVEPQPSKAAALSATKFSKNTMRTLH